MSTLSGKYSVNGNLSILNGMSCKNGTIDFEGASFVDGCIPLTAVSDSSATTQSSSGNLSNIATIEFVENAISAIPKLNYLSDMTGPTIQTQLNTISSTLPNYLTTSSGNTYAPINNSVLTGTPKAPTPGINENSDIIATTAFVQSNISSIVSVYAPIDSPELTGAPKAPTPNTDDNTTKIATTAFVQSNLSNYLTTSSGSTYAPIDSPILTGTPKAPTPLTDDSTTNIATTAYVKSNLSTIVSTYAPIDNPVFTGTPKAPTPSIEDEGSDVIATTAYVKEVYKTVAKIFMNLSAVNNQLYIIYTNTNSGNASFIRYETNIGSIKPSLINPFTGIIQFTRVYTEKNIILPSTWSSPTAGQKGYVMTGTLSAGTVAANASKNQANVALGVGVWIIVGQIQFPAINGIYGLSISTTTGAVDNSCYLQMNIVGGAFFNLSRVITNTVGRSVYLVTRTGAVGINPSPANISLIAVRIA